MTIKEAILLSLEDFPYGAIMREVYDNILKKNIFKFSKEAQTPDATVSALLGDMIRKGDVRIKRFKMIRIFFAIILASIQKI